MDCEAALSPGLSPWCCCCCRAPPPPLLLLPASSPPSAPRAPAGGQLAGKAPAGAEGERGPGAGTPLLACSSAGRPLADAPAACLQGRFHAQQVGCGSACKKS